MEGRTQRARIADVATAAGVSKTAVSFAFNNPDRLSAETALRIREIAEGLGYRPDPVARLLTQRRTMTLGVLTPQPLAVVFGNPFFAVLGAGIAAAAEAQGYELHFISPLQGSLARAVGRAAVDGVLGVGISADHPDLAEIRRAGLPIVLVDSEDARELSSVVVDDEGGARAAAEHVLAYGHREILVLAVEGPLPSSRRRRTGVTARRLVGYRSAMEAAGVRLLEDRIVAGQASLAAGADAFRQAWSSDRRPTAVLAMSDAMAIGAMRAARELGIGIPADVSIVGFDDIDLAGQVDPPLTTVHQPIAEKGAEAVRLLLAAIESRDLPSGGRPEHVRLATWLVVRASTGPVPA